MVGIRFIGRDQHSRTRSLIKYSQQCGIRATHHRESCGYITCCLEFWSEVKTKRKIMITLTAELV